MQHLMHTCPAPSPQCKHQGTGAAGLGTHGHTLTNSTSHSQGQTHKAPACSHVCMPTLQGQPQGCGHGGAFRLESRGVSVGIRPGLPPHKGQDPQRLSSHTALSSATPPAPAGWEGGPGYAPFLRAGGLTPSPLSLGRPGPGRAPARPCACLGGGRPPGGPEPESPLPSPHLSFPRRSTTGTKWQSAAPRAGRDAPRPAGQARRPPRTAPSAGGTSRPAAALPRPGPPGPRQRWEPGSNRAGHAHCGLPPGEGQPRA